MANALEAHERALELGGLSGIPNPHLIQSAIARPYSGYYRRIHQKAAALVQSMAGNHGFTDGNKRTALILVDLLLTESGYRLVPIDGNELLEDALENMVLAAVTHALTFDGLAEWFRRCVAKA